MAKHSPKSLIDDIRNEIGDQALIVIDGPNECVWVPSDENTDPLRAIKLGQELTKKWRKNKSPRKKK